MYETFTILGEQVVLLHDHAILLWLSHSIVGIAKSSSSSVLRQYMLNRATCSAVIATNFARLARLS